MEPARILFTKPTFRWLFGGMGFHNSEATMLPLMSDALRNERAVKSFRELSPTFSRVFAGFHDWTQEAMDHFAEYYHQTFATADCTLYVVPGRLPHYIYESDERAAEFAESVAQKLRYLIEEKGCRLIRYYCIANEMSVGNQYARYAKDLERFKRHQQMLYDAFLRHGLHNVGLIAPDTSGEEQLWQVEWATKNMDEITDTYCSHIYQHGGHPFGDTGYYAYFKDLMTEPVQIARRKEKRFILGEFGQHNGGWLQETDAPAMVKDVNDGYGDAAQEERIALMTCVTALAAMNAGALATVYWTFMDYPDPFLRDDGNSPEARARHEVARFSGHGTSVRYNKNGLFRWSEDGDYSARAYYYSLGLLSRYFRKHARLLAPQCEEESLVCAGVTNPDGSASLCVMNYSDAPRAALVSAEHPASKPYRVYTYACGRVAYNACGDLPAHDGTLSPDADGCMALELPPYSFVLLTTDYQDRTPAAVDSVTVTEERIAWKAVDEKEHCYYRVYENGVQIGSTVADYLERKTKENAVYTVKSVDKHGNVSQ